MSVASTRARPSSAGWPSRRAVSASATAIVYGSSPEAQPADQARTSPRRAFQSPSIHGASARHVSTLRKNLVTLMVSASSSKSYSSASSSSSRL
ncbi:MAG: hypothetical protein DMD34_15710 [Gemmatimonadetes bacterium]|nr:MAG: hypothetical protein DMD34_15710 [Gemmatimonadota bacterium]